MMYMYYFKTVSNKILHDYSVLMIQYIVSIDAMYVMSNMEHRCQWILCWYIYKHETVENNSLMASDDKLTCIN